MVRLAHWVFWSAAQLGGICQQGGDEAHLEAVCKPEAQAGLVACVVQVCDDLTEEEGDHSGKHVVDGQGTKGQGHNVACRQAGGQAGGQAEGGIQSAATAKAHISWRSHVCTGPVTRPTLLGSPTCIEAGGKGDARPHPLAQEGGLDVALHPLRCRQHIRQQAALLAASHGV